MVPAAPRPVLDSTIHSIYAKGPAEGGRNHGCIVLSLFFLVSPECGRYLIANCSAGVKIRWRIKLVHISDVNPDEAKIMAITTNWYIAA